jgi:hypothetical protein
MKRGVSKKKHALSAGRCGTHDSYRASCLRDDTVKLWCSLCRDHIGLGPSTDTTEALVELRAAEIARSRNIKSTPREKKGWALAKLGLDAGNDAAGWLAWHIFTHEKHEHEQKDSMKIYSIEVVTDLGRRVVQLSAPFDVDPTGPMPPHFRELATDVLWGVLRQVALQGNELAAASFKAEA